MEVGSGCARVSLPRFVAGTIFVSFPASSILDNHSAHALLSRRSGTVHATCARRCERVVCAQGRMCMAQSCGNANDVTRHMFKSPAFPYKGLRREGDRNGKARFVQAGKNRDSRPMAFDVQRGCPAFCTSHQQNGLRGLLMQAAEQSGTRTRPCNAQ